jgi:radial spoke head protein 3
MQAAPYSHSQQPHAVASRPKYRDPAEVENSTLASNLMYDKRVVRGNTYAAQILPATAQAEQLEMERKSQMQKSAKRTKLPPKPDTPPAADGRKHIDVQTEQYLEELTDRPIEADTETQTDAFMDQLPAPIFIPMKTGVDVETQIYDGELFDFDAEVDPILEVLVGKTLEQSMMEVMEEEELANMRAHQEHFEQIRNSELAETQRLEEAEKRRFEEKERRIGQERERVEREQQVTEKVAARTFAKGFLSELHSSVVDNLKDAGFFYDPLEQEVTSSFLPGLMQQVDERLESMRTSRALAGELIEAAALRSQAMLAEAAKLRTEVEAAKAKLAAEKAEAAAAAAAEAEAAAAAAAAAAAEAAGEEGAEPEAEA